MGKKAGKNFVSFTQEKMCSPQLNGNNYKISARFSILILKNCSFGSMGRLMVRCSWWLQYWVGTAREGLTGMMLNP